MASLRKPERYLAEPGLVDACNVALLLGQPLLLTGDPGTGKTQFAHSLAWELGLGELIKFETKSTSTSRELFYTYDALKRFQDSQSGEKASSALPYINYGALGTAILRTKAREEVDRYLPSGFEHKGKCRSVVLIDEVDKAPRDFPNDILNEIELMYFRLPELGNVKLEADPDLLPIVIITSNSEKDLPDAFLRRCVYYNIPFPQIDRLREIIANRLNVAPQENPFLEEALGLFFRLRECGAGLRKPPATAELLGWILALQELAPGEANPLSQRDRARQTLSSLVKTRDDQERAKEIIDAWANPSKPSTSPG